MKKRKNRFLVDFPRGVIIEDVVKFCSCLGTCKAHIDLHSEEYPVIKFMERKERKKNESNI